MNRKIKELLMRAGVLIYHPKLNSILTIYRYKNGQHYYVLSGGQIEKSESPIEAAKEKSKKKSSLFLSQKT